jgi:tetratricopeptide (TPR) repeat protein
MDANQTVEQLQEKDLGDPRAEEAYQAFHNAKDAGKKIKLGEAFINKYASSWHIQAVYEELTQTYYSNQDLANFCRCSDKGIALYPDDVTLLAMTGWIIPRAYKHDDPDGDKRLDTAEKYEKHAIEALKIMKKPNMPSDQQFNLYKTQESATAHSALGLIYFRQSKFDDSVKEIQEATQDASKPGPTDFMVLGADFQNLSRFKEAADAFNRCAQIAGPLQAGCKDYADRSMKQAEQAK